MQKKSQTIIDVSKNLDTSFNESCQNCSMLKNLDTSFKEVDKSDNEECFELFSSDKDMDSLNST